LTQNNNYCNGRRRERKTKTFSFNSTAHGWQYDAIAASAIGGNIDGKMIGKSVYLNCCQYFIFIFVVFDSVFPAMLCMFLYVAHYVSDGFLHDFLFL
jgi:hypothetical protein